MTEPVLAKETHESQTEVLQVLSIREHALSTQKENIYMRAQPQTRQHPM